jgi:hypothetical protein
VIGVNERYFVTIVASERASFLRLHEYDMDLIHGSARVVDREHPTIEALVTLEEVARLVRGGYRVLVEEESWKRARAVEQVVSFDRWLEEMGD